MIIRISRSQDEGMAVVVDQLSVGVGDCNEQDSEAINCSIALVSTYVYIN